MSTLPSHRIRDRSRLHGAMLAAALAFGSLGVNAFESGSVHADGALVVAVDHVVPQYKAGAKFRSPATIDTALAEDLARRLQVPLAMVGAAQSDAGQADLRFTTVADVRSLPPAVAVIPVDYRSAPMAIMRTDSTIRGWEQLRARKVCVAEDGNHVGTVADRYGAVEIVYPAPTDALVALRTGDCDALVHDSVMLEELLRYPEWKKFSRRLHSSERSTLAVLVPAEDKAAIAAVRQITADWRAKAYPVSLVKNAVRNIAFEVYLEQDVPDCH